MRGIRVVEVGNYMAGPFVRGLGSPLRLGRTRLRLERAGPLLGEHSRDVLTELGCDEGEIARLVREGCIA